GDAARLVDRNRKADAIETARAAENRGVDADDAAVGVEERAAGIAGIDRGVGLDEIFVALDAEAAAAERADDAAAHRLADAERVADREHDVADLEFVAVAERRGGQAGRIDL